MTKMQDRGSGCNSSCARRSFSATLALFSLSLLFCLLPVAFAWDQPRDLDMPTEVTGPFQKPGAVESRTAAQSYMSFSSPPLLADGKMAFAMSHYVGPNFVVSPEQAAVGNFTVTNEIVIPHIDDGIEGCDPLTSNYTTDGDLIRGKILLVRRRPCRFQPKLEVAMAAGVAALIIFNCDDCEPGLLRIIDATSTIPVVFIDTFDGNLLYNYLTQRAVWRNNGSQPQQPGETDYSQPMIASVIGTGALDPVEFEAWKVIAGTMDLPVDIAAAASSLVHWSELLSDNPPDPCLQRIIGVYCERGHVHSVYLKYLSITGTIDAAWGQFKQMTQFSITENTPSTQGKKEENITDKDSRNDRKN